MIAQTEETEAVAEAVVEAGGNPLIALLFVIGGIIVGSIIGRLVRAVLAAESRPRPIRDSAGAISALAFSIVLIGSLITALGIISPAALDQLEDDVIAFIPRALAAAIVLIIANVVAQLLETAATSALSNASPMARDRVPSFIKLGILGFAGIVAANQIGIDTTIITIAVGSVFFSLALTASILAGLGGRDVASDLAAGRALRQLLSVGDSVVTSDIDGIVAAIGSTTTQITSPDRVVLVPNTELLSKPMNVVPVAGSDDPEQTT